MSNVRIQTDGLRKVEVPAAKLWSAAQTQRSLEHYRKKITEYVNRSLIPLSLRNPCSRNKSISTGIACANVLSRDTPSNIAEIPAIWMTSQHEIG
jgi:fumarate hydratase class II